MTKYMYVCARAEPSFGIDREYIRLMEHETLYQEAVGKWERINKLSEILFFAFLIITMGIIFSLTPDEEYSLLAIESKISIASIIAFTFFFITSLYSERKVSEIKGSLGLTNDEKIFLEISGAKDKIVNCLKEENRDRIKHYKEKASESFIKIIKLANKWNYGNMKYTKELIGSQIDLFKNNLDRLILPNIMLGNEDDLSTIIDVLDRFSYYILSPSIEEMNVINDVMGGLEYREYEIITRRLQFKNYFKRRKLLSRLLFTSFCVLVIGIISVNFSLEMPYIFAALIATFWGAFNGFDKIFFSEK